MKVIPHFSYAISQRYVSDFSAELGVERALTISGWIRSRSLPHLTSCVSLFPEALSNRELLRHLMQIEAFFKKNSVFSGAHCKEAAVSAFKKAEVSCSITNKRLDHYFDKRDRLDPDLAIWWTKAENWITSTLGDFNIFLDNLPRELKITAGATSTRPRKHSQPHMKLSMKPVCTPGAVPYLQALSKFFGYGKLRPVLTLCNRVVPVRKNWKTDRIIACEPEGNIPLQLAFDSYAKKRLLKRGIDLRHQSKNQRLARESSLDGLMATLDLSMASDTVSFNTVASLFPYEWFQYLNDIRSPFYNFEGVISSAKYSKFSSMGNGSTFTVETLIFSAACHAVGCKQFSVYGDDLIIPVNKVADLTRFLRFLGFTINQEKSHFQGSFRESCGVNFYNGIDLTPFYVRESSRVKPIVCHNINGLARIALPGGALEDYLLDLIDQFRLPLVPFSRDSMSGIFIDVSSAYRLKVIRCRHTGDRKSLHIPMFKAFSAKNKKYTVSDLRTLFIWHLKAFCSESAKRDVVISSSVPMSSHKYVRKWVHWIPPVVGTPVHLYWWTDKILVRRKAD